MKPIFEFGLAKIKIHNQKYREEKIRGWYFNKQNKLVIIDEDNIRLQERDDIKIKIIKNPKLMREMLK